MAFKVGAIYGHATLDASSFLYGMKRISLSVQSFATMAGVVVIGAVEKIRKATNDFEKTMSNVSTMVDTTTTDMKMFERGILSMSSTLGSATELTEGLYQAISSGIKAGDALAFVEESAKFATAALTDTFTAVDVLTTAVNAYGMAASDVTKVSDIFFKTIEKGKIIGTELAQYMGNVLPIAAAVGVSLEETSAALAAMSLQGTNMAKGTTQLTQVLQAFLKPSADMLEWIHEMGYASGTAMLQALGLEGTLSLVAEQTERSSEEMNKLFRNVRGLRGAMGLTGQGGIYFAEILTDIENASGATELALSKQELSFKALGNAIEKVGITIGKSFFNVVSEGATDMAEMLDNLALVIYDTDTLSRVLVPLMNILGKAITLIGGLLNALRPVVVVVWQVVEAVLKLANALLDAFIPVLVEAVSAISEMIGIALKPVLDIVNSLVAMLTESGLIDFLAKFLEYMLSFARLQLAKMFAQLTLQFGVFKAAIQIVLAVLKPLLDLLMPIYMFLMDLYILMNGKLGNALMALSNAFATLFPKYFLKALAFVADTFLSVFGIDSSGLSMLTENLGASMAENFAIALDAIEKFIDGLFTASDSWDVFVKKMDPVIDALLLYQDVIILTKDAFLLAITSMMSGSVSGWLAIIDSFKVGGKLIMDVMRLILNPSTFFMNPAEFIKTLNGIFSEAVLGSVEVVKKTIDDSVGVTARGLKKVLDDTAKLFDEKGRAKRRLNLLTLFYVDTKKLHEEWNLAKEEIAVLKDELTFMTQGAIGNDVGSDEGRANPNQGGWVDQPEKTPDLSWFDDLLAKAAPVKSVFENYYKLLKNIAEISDKTDTDKAIARAQAHADMLVGLGLEFPKTIFQQFSGITERYNTVAEELRTAFNTGAITFEQYVEDMQLNFRKGVEETLEAVNNALQYFSGLFETVIGGLNKTLNMYWDAEVDKLENKKNAEQKIADEAYARDTERLQQQLDAALITEDQYMAQKEAMDTAYANAKADRDNEYAQREDKLRKKQFEANKAYQIANIWIQTALGTVTAVTQAISLLGPIAGPIVGAALGAALFGLAVAQTAIISKQQYVPSAAIGGEVTKGGLVRVDEEGGEIKRFPTGTVIVPSDVSKFLAKEASRGSTSTNVTINNPVVRNDDDITKIAKAVSRVLGRQLKLRRA